ncbi:MAG: PulJ/GspJ family protein [Pseudomonadota bacterium]
MLPRQCLSGFSLLEVLVASAILALWLPASLYTLQLALAEQAKVQQKALLLEQMWLLKADIERQWQRGEPSAQHQQIDWQLSSVDPQQAHLTLTAEPYRLEFWLHRQQPVAVITAGVNPVELKK